MTGRDADNSLGDNMKFLAFAMAAATMGAGSAQAAETIIGFQPLQLANSVPVTYTESGYTIQSNNTREPVPGFIANSTLTLQKFIGANDSGVPSVNFGRSTSFTLSGGTFKFEGLSAYFSSLNGASNSFTVVGFLFDKQLYSTEFALTGGVLQQTNVFRDFASGSVAVFDKLVFTSGAVSGQIVLDDIRLSAATIPTPDPVLPPVTAAVPEPATWAMMILGFAVVGGMMRRRRYQAAVQYA